MRCFEVDFRPLVVAGGRAYSSQLVTIYRQALDVEHSPADALVGFAGLSDTECECVAHEFVCVEASDAISVCNACEVDEVNKRVFLIERLPLEHPPDKGLRRRSVSGRILATLFIDTPCSLDTRDLLQRLRGEFLAKLFAHGIYFLPQWLAEKRVLAPRFHSSPHETLTNIQNLT